MTGVVLSCFSSCRNEQELQQETQEVKRSLCIEEAKALLAEEGYDVSTLEETEEYYVVEGDIVIYKEDLLQPDTKQMKGPRTIDLSVVKANSFYVYTDNSIPTSGNGNWRPAIEEACRHWRDIGGCLIRLIPTSSPRIANITISFDNGLKGTTTMAQAPQPRNTSGPGPWLHINPDYNNIGHSEKVYVIVHELGHTLGFKHTDGTDGTHIEGTPLRDPASIMNSSYGGGGWPGFSQGDIIAAQKLYPDWVWNVGSHRVGEFGHGHVHNLQLSYESLLPLNRLSIYSTPAANFTLHSFGNGTGNVSVVFPAPGDYTISVKAEINGKDPHIKTFAPLRVYYGKLSVIGSTSVQTGSYVKYTALHDPEYPLVWSFDTSLDHYYANNKDELYVKFNTPGQYTISCHTNTYPIEGYNPTGSITVTAR